MYLMYLFNILCVAGWAWFSMMERVPPEGALRAFEPFAWLHSNFLLVCAPRLQGLCLFITLGVILVSIYKIFGICWGLYSGKLLGIIWV